jgi:hypothetical protein
MLRPVFACAALLGGTLFAQSPFATRVVAFDDKGRAGGGIFAPQNALGAPRGTFDVHSLGIGGSLTLGFDVVITDGPGADLLIAENPFLTGGIGESFAETMFVEVASNGSDFARVPSRYGGPDVSPGPFGVAQIGWYAGLAGAMPVRAGAADPQDVVGAGGDAIDLADLRDHPLVVAGRVDLTAITQVRLVDVVDGVDRDSAGRVLRDAGGGSADVDAVTAVQHRGNQDPRGPRIGLEIPADGDWRLRIEDPDGLGDLDPASWKVALFGIPVSPVVLLQLAQVTDVTATGFTLRLGFPLPAGMPWPMACSIKDRAGNRSGAMRTRPL